MYAKAFISGATLLALAACGSSGGSLPDQTSLRVVAADQNGTSTFGGELNRGNNTLRLGDVTGTLQSDDRALTDDGTITFDYGLNTHSASYSDGERLGVFGTRTARDDVPLDGSATYRGDSDIVLITDAGIYELEGDAVVTVRFRNNDLSASLGGLDGQFSNGIDAPRNVSDVMSVEISDVTISGNRLSGGDIALNSSRSDITVTSNADAALNGSFFGPNADEVGAAFTLDDSIDGSVLLIGTFKGD